MCYLAPCPRCQWLTGVNRIAVMKAKVVDLQLDGEDDGGQATRNDR